VRAIRSLRSAAIPTPHLEATPVATKHANGPRAVPRQFRLVWLAVVIVLLSGCSWFQRNEPPVIVIHADKLSGPAPLHVGFDASGSYDPDGDAIALWDWRFGDGQSDQGMEVTHTYELPGAYTARVTVVDAAGSSSEAMLQVNVFYYSTTGQTEKDTTTVATESGASVTIRHGILPPGVPVAVGDADLAENERLLEALPVCRAVVVEIPAASILSWPSTASGKQVQPHEIRQDGSMIIEIPLGAEGVPPYTVLQVTVSLSGGESSVRWVRPLGLADRGRVLFRGISTYVRTTTTKVVVNVSGALSKARQAAEVLGEEVVGAVLSVKAGLLSLADEFGKIDAWLQDNIGNKLAQQFRRFEGQTLIPSVSVLLDVVPHTDPASVRVGVNPDGSLPKPLPEAGQLAVILVHGFQFLGEGITFEDFEELVEDRWGALAAWVARDIERDPWPAKPPRLYGFVYDPFRRVSENGKDLATWLSYFSGRQVVIIAHSMGGLVARSAIEEHGASVLRLITLGTPHQGTPLAAEGFINYVIDTEESILELPRSLDPLPDEYVAVVKGLLALAETAGGRDCEWVPEGLAAFQGNQWLRNLNARIRDTKPDETTYSLYASDSISAADTGGLIGQVGSWLQNQLLGETVGNDGVVPYPSAIWPSTLGLPVAATRIERFSGLSHGSLRTAEAPLDAILEELRTSATVVVTLTLYVHDGSTGGPVLSGALVAGYDGVGTSFSQTTNTSGYVTITGQPGMWHFSVSKSGYETNSWDEDTSSEVTRHTYLTVTPTPTVTTPTVETRAATSVGPTSATVSGAVTSTGGASITERRFDWGTTSSCSDGWTNSVTVSGDTFSFQMTGLSPSTKYYFRAWAKNSAGWGQGTPLSFTTTAAVNLAPTVSRLSPSSSSVTTTRGVQTTFSVTAADADGDLAHVEWFVGGESQVVHAISGSSTTDSWSYTFGATGSYVVQAYVYDTDHQPANIATSWGVTVNDPTATVVVPTVETRAATSVGPTSATVSGAVTSTGGASITERRFDWGTTSSCSDGWTNSVTVSGDTFSFQMTGLSPSTKYYFRAWAKNSSGWGQGTVLTFTTSSPTATGAIQGWTVTPNPATAGQSSVGFSAVVKNTGTGTYTFPVGLSVWKVGSSIDTAVINEWKSVTLAAGAQQTVTFTSHTFSSSEAGSWYYQFGQWTSDRATLLDKKPSPAEILTVSSPPPTLTFTGLSPSTIPTSSSTYRATLQATGSNFLNVNRVSYSWSGPDNGSMIWNQGDANWNAAVTVGSDGSMTLRPVVLSNETSSQSKTWTWTVTLRDNTGATASRSFTVTYNPPSPAPVTLTLYVHDGSASGPVLLGVSVTGHDGASNSFSQTTNASGYVTITGQPGMWHFSASKSGYQTNTWDQSTTVNVTRHAYFIRATPALRVDGGLASQRARGGTFAFTGWGFTPYASATQHIIKPSGQEITGGVSADASGSIGWSFTSVATSDLGTYDIWVSDPVAGSSNHVTEVIVP